MDPKSAPNIVFENGTLLGLMPQRQSTRHCHSFVIPEIVISSSQSNNSLHRNREESGGRAVSTNSIDRTLRTCNDHKICSGQCVLRPCGVISSNMPNASVDLRSASESKNETCSDGNSIRANNTNSSASETTVMAALEIGFPPQYSNIYRDCRQNLMGSESVTPQAQQARNIPPEGDRTSSIQYFQCCQQLPEIAHQNSHHDHSTTMNVTVPISGRSFETGGILLNTNTNITRSSSEVPVGGCSIRKWFLRPSLPFVIGVFALGGVACTLGGIVLGCTGLLEHSTQYLSAALLMIGIGVSLIVISGAIWRLSLLDDVDDCRCFRRFETCRNCHNPQCNNRQLRDGYIYPEFQHRPPPPSYLTSLNEYTLVYYPNIHSIGITTPPPLYRSTYSLNVLGAIVPSAGISQLQENVILKNDRSPSVTIKRVKSFDQLTSTDISEAGPLIQGTEDDTTEKDDSLIEICKV